MVGTVEAKTLYITAAHAGTFFARFMGLMFRRSLAPVQGLLLSNCRSIHTCFMRFPIDVVFLDGDFCVVAVVENLRPWRAIGYYAAVCHVLELSAGSVKRLEINRGDLLRFPLAPLLPLR